MLLWREDHLNCWVKGKEFSVSAMSIQNFLQIRPVILESSSLWQEDNIDIGQSTGSWGRSEETMLTHYQLLSCYENTGVYHDLQPLPSEESNNSLPTMSIVPSWPVPEEWHRHLWSHLLSSCKVHQQEEVPDDFAFLGIDHVYHATWEGLDSLRLASYEEKIPDFCSNDVEEQSSSSWPL